MNRAFRAGETIEDYCRRVQDRSPATFGALRNGRLEARSVRWPHSRHQGWNDAVLRGLWRRLQNVSM